MTESAYLLSRLCAKHKKISKMGQFGIEKTKKFNTQQPRAKIPVLYRVSKCCQIGKSLYDLLLPNQWNLSFEKFFKG